MRARAPGKVVLSGAYVVLDGAPAVVASVSAYAVADTSRHPRRVSPELAAAFGDAPPPVVDTRAMRRRGQKLGVGSSSAATVAAIAADRWSRLTPGHPDRERGSIARAAYAAHRAAQGGGSGIDVVACTFGGVRVCRRTIDGALPRHEAASLPGGLVTRLFSCPESARTSALVGRVRALRDDRPELYADVMSEAALGAEAFASALAAGDVDAALRGAGAQRAAMVRLQEASGALILPDYMLRGHALTAAEGAVLAQAGAGGGDVAIYFGASAPSDTTRRALAALGLAPLSLTLGVDGVHEPRG
ncbi:MAG: hypothetical protein IT374_19105 [Polyangiaceae bacterium]|nr:hypothetical protein [Polyangiaceae bacterium]